MKLYLLYGNTSYDTETRAALRLALPEGWVLADAPDGASAILAVGMAVDADAIGRAGRNLSWVATTEPSDPGLAGLPPDVRVATIPTESYVSQRVVAEYAVAMLLALFRNLPAITRSTVDDEWSPGRDRPILTDQATYTYNWTDLQTSGFLFGKTIGIVGLGAIGSAVAEMLAPHRVRILYTQRHRLPVTEEERLGVHWREFVDLVRDCDAITLHHRLQEGPGGNEAQFGAREFAAMKATAFLVNTARGRILDEPALVEALRTHEIAGAALDVFHYEPLPQDHPLLAMAGDRLLLTPHIAAGSEAEYWRHVLRIALEE